LWREVQAGDHSCAPEAREPANLWNLRRGAAWRGQLSGNRLKNTL